MMFALPVDGPATDRHSSCVVYVSCNGPGPGGTGREGGREELLGLIRRDV